MVKLLSLCNCLCLRVTADEARRDKHALPLSCSFFDLLRWREPPCTCALCWLTSTVPRPFGMSPL